MDLCGARPCRFPGSPHGCPKHCHPAPASAHDTHCDAYVTHCDAYVLLFLGWARAGLVHVSVNYNARTDELAHLATRPEPATVFHVTLLAEHVAAALTHPRHPQRGTLAAVEPSTCPDGAATKAARLTRNSTATLT